MLSYSDTHSWGTVVVLYDTGCSCYLQRDTMRMKHERESRRCGTVRYSLLVVVIVTDVPTLVLGIYQPPPEPPRSRVE